MKKFLLITLLAGAFTFLSTTTTQAQTVSNFTACPIDITVGFGLPGCLVLMGSTTITVPPFMTVPAPIPPGSVILGSKGSHYPSTACPYYIGAPCTGLPLTDFVFCTLPCGNYTATLAAGNVVVF